MNSVITKLTNCVVQESVSLEREVPSATQGLIKTLASKNIDVLLMECAEEKNLKITPVVILMDLLENVTMVFVVWIEIFEVLLEKEEKEEREDSFLRRNLTSILQILMNSLSKRKRWKIKRFRMNNSPFQVFYVDVNYFFYFYQE